MLFHRVDRLLSHYFLEGAYRFQMQFGRSTFEDFYGPTEESAAILAERSKWLAADPAKYVAVTPQSEDLLNEFFETAISAGTLPGDFRLEPGSTLEQKARRLGESLEPDYLLLTRTDGALRLAGGCVCFPSAWILEEKVGQLLSEIHEVVPGLNTAIGRKIDTFLQKLKPGACWTRSNWGLSRSAELNQHPSRKLPRLDAGVTLNEVFFRVEEQALTILPLTSGILFGIRLRVAPLRDFLGTEAGSKLKLALETMPDAMAAYKGIAAARARIISLLAT